MGSYAYKGVDENGARRTGRIEANSQDEALAALRSLGIVASGIALDKQPVKIEDWMARKRNVPQDQLVLFTRQMATLIDANVSILQALGIMERQIENVRFKDVIRDLIESIESGEQLVVALRKHPDVFGPIYTSMIEAGESSGSLDNALLQLATQLERDAKLRKQVKAAMRYPLFILIFTLLTLALLLIFVVPRFTKMFSTLGGELPLPTRMVKELSSVLVPPDGRLIPLVPALGVGILILGVLAMVFCLRRLKFPPVPAFLIAAGIWVALGGFLYLLQYEPAWLPSSPLTMIPGGASLVAFFFTTDLPSAFIDVPQIVAILGRLVMLYGVFLLMRMAWRRYVKTPDGRRAWDSFRLRAPMKIGPLVQKVSMARFTRTLATLIGSGVPILSAFDIVRSTAGNVLIEEACDDARQRVAVGSHVHAALDQSSAFPQMVTRMVQIGEETGSLDQMLLKAAEYYEEEVDIAMKNLTSLVEPIMIVLIGAIVGGIVISLYLPIFSIYSLLDG